MQNIILFSLEPGELKKIVFDTLNEVLEKNVLVKKESDEPEPEKLLSIRETKDLLKISLPTLHQWKKTGKIPFYRISNRVYFKRSEILESLKKARGLNEK